MIPKKEIDEVLSRVVLSDVIGDYLTLKKSGSGKVCNCPFHKENTGSFHVHDVKGIYKCFGCGESGNAVTFLQKHQGMTFVEAIHALASKYHVTLHDQEVVETAEQRQLRLDRESMIVQLQLAQDFFEQNLRNADKEADAAHMYALSRWSQDDIESEGFGYAYLKGQTLVDYAKSHSMSLEILHKCGLLGKDEERNRYYDAMRGRLTMPLRDRMKRVIAYTARIIPGSTDAPNKEGKVPPKYVNTADTILYQKGSTLFGLDLAWNEAAKADKCYCVEGGPDALRLRFLGIPNVVACLGAEWTPGQLELLRSRCATLCFIPDADPPKQGQQFGVGVEKVIKAGKMAFQNRFQVFVKEIGVSDKGEKRDADSLFKSKKQFTDDFLEDDYILWYARKLFPQGGSNSKNINKDQALENITRIAEILSYLDEGYELNHYVDQLNQIHPGKITWQNAVRQARVRRAEENMANNLHEEEKLLAKLGFGIENGGYYSLNAQGGHYAWSNFTMKPLYHIRDTQSAIRLYEMSNHNGYREFVELRQDDLISLAKFRVKIESLGNYIWYAKEDQLIKLKSYLYQVTQTAEMITQLGWQEGGFFAYGNGIYYNGKWIAVDEYGIVRIEHASLENASKNTTSNYYLPAFSKLYINTQYFEFERSFVHKGYGNISLYAYTQILMGVFGNNAMIGICFLLATLFRDVVVSQTKWFPILNLFGPKNSGKSELGHCLMAFFIIENRPPNIENSTIAALSDAVAQCRNALVHLDEYKDSIETAKREFLKGLWDGTGRNRMNMDKDKKREVTKVDAGIIISGQEMATIDIALFTRFVFLTFNLPVPSTEQTNRFEHMTDVRKLGCSHLTLELLAHRPVFEQNFHSAYLSVLDDLQTRLKGFGIEPRILKNWVVPLAAFQSLRNKVSLPFTIEDAEKFAVEAIKLQSEKCKSNQEVGIWWDIINFLYSDNKIYNGCHFRIEPVHELTIEESEEPIRYPQDPMWVLYLRVKPLFELYLEHSKKTGQKVLPKSSLDFYLEHCPELIGSKRSVRFDKIIDGVVQYKLDENGVYTKRKDSFTDSVLCFNYDELAKHYKINLH